MRISKSILIGSIFMLLNMWMYELGGGYGRFFSLPLSIFWFRFSHNIVLAYCTTCLNSLFSAFSLANGVRAYVLFSSVFCFRCILILILIYSQTFWEMARKKQEPKARNMFQTSFLKTNLYSISYVRWNVGTSSRKNYHHVCTNFSTEIKSPL